MPIVFTIRQIAKVSDIKKKYIKFVSIQMVKDKFSESSIGTESQLTSNTEVVGEGG